MPWLARPLDLADKLVSSRQTPLAQLRGYTLLVSSSGHSQWHATLKPAWEWPVDEANTLQYKSVAKGTVYTDEKLTRWHVTVFTVELYQVI